MPLSDILTSVFAGVAFWLVLVLLLRVWGWRVEVKLKPVKRRRRRPIEPDEHTAFL